MLWIKYRRGKDIPQDLLYDGWQTDKNKIGQTPLMIRIEHHYGKDIPQ